MQMIQEREVIIEVFCFKKDGCQSRGPITDSNQSQGARYRWSRAKRTKTETARGSKTLPSAFKELLKSSGTCMIKVRYHISFK